MANRRERQQRKRDGEPLGPPGAARRLHRPLMPSGRAAASGRAARRSARPRSCPTRDRWRPRQGSCATALINQAPPLAGSRSWTRPPCPTGPIPLPSSWDRVGRSTDDEDVSDRLTAIDDARSGRLSPTLHHIRIALRQLRGSRARDRLASQCRSRQNKRLGAPNELLTCLGSLTLPSSSNAEQRSDQPFLRQAALD